MKESSLFILTLLHRIILSFYGIFFMVSFFLESVFLKQEQRRKSDSERKMFSSFLFITFFRK